MVHKLREVIVQHFAVRGSWRRSGRWLTRNRLCASLTPPPVPDCTWELLAWILLRVLPQSLTGHLLGSPLGKRGPGHSSHSPLLRLHLSQGTLESEGTAHTGAGLKPSVSQLGTLDLEAAGCHQPVLGAAAGALDILARC